MADPNPFEPGYSYSSWQASNPTKPLPAPRIDDDFANIARATGELADAVKDIRRSDGTLKNGIVTRDSLAPNVVDDLLLVVDERVALAAAEADRAEAAAEAAVVTRDQTMGYRLDAWNARDDAQAARDGAFDARDDAVAARDKAQIVSQGVEGWVLRAETAALALENPDYGFFVDPPTDNRDYGAFA